jgi:hypothetical protein
MPLGGVALACNLLFLSLSAFWTVQDRREGVNLGMLGCGVFVASAAVMVVLLGSPYALLGDIVLAGSRAPID